MPVVASTLVVPPVRSPELESVVPVVVEVVETGVSVPMHGSLATLDPRDVGR